MPRGRMENVLAGRGRLESLRHAGVLAACLDAFLRASASVGRSRAPWVMSSGARDARPVPAEQVDRLGHCFRRLSHSTSGHVGTMLWMAEVGETLLRSQFMNMPPSYPSLAPARASVMAAASVVFVCLTRGDDAWEGGGKKGGGDEDDRGLGEWGIGLQI